MGPVIMKKIYILHGWTYSLDKWEKFAGLLKSIGFEPIFLKIPGLTQDSDEVWDIKRYSDWLNKELSRDSGKVILLGHSNGGRIAAFFSAEHPEKIQRLILVDSAGIYHKELALQIKRFVFGSVAKIGKKIANSEVLKKFLYRLAGEKDYQSASPNMKKSMISLISTDITPILGKILTPTLIVWGENDLITPITDGKIMNGLIKNSKFKIIGNAKHSPFYTHPQELIDILKNDL
jgi:pimeloyl-ACP methyl ester carboxylesterase